MINLLPNVTRDATTALTEIDRIGDREHFVQFYEKDTALVEGVVRFFASGFALGNVAVIIATKDHREAVEQGLIELGMNVEKMRQSGKYSAFDAAEMLGYFMVNGRPDARRFRALLGTWMEVARRESTGIRAFGEMVALLCADGNEEGAIELEHLWNELGETHEFSLYCAYPADQFGDEGARGHAHICRAHSRVIRA